MIHVILLVCLLLTVSYRAINSVSRYLVSASTPTKDPDSLHQAVLALLPSTLQSRALVPATRVFEALFQVRNPFVSSSQGLQRHWRKTLLSHFYHTNASDWAGISAVVRSALSHHLRASNIEPIPGQRTTSMDVNLQDVSRDVTLAAVLRALFGIVGVDSALLTHIGTEIQDLFLAKKAFDSSCQPNDHIPIPLRRRADALIATLRTLLETVGSDDPASRGLVKDLLYADFEDVDQGQAANPLSLVIPAFESTWRVVFYTLLATLRSHPAPPYAPYPAGVYSRGTNSQHHYSNRYISALHGFHPENAIKPPALVQAIISETLRLYPPIRRIRRAVNPASPDQTAVVDIEQIQRDEKYWGASALDFVPERFLVAAGPGCELIFRVPVVLDGPAGDRRGAGEGEKISDAREAWLPFSMGKMQCPTAKGYGVKMVATVVGTVLRGVFPSDSILGEDGMREVASIRSWWLEGLDETSKASYEHPDAIVEHGNAALKVLKAGRAEYRDARLCVAREVV